MEYILSLSTQARSFLYSLGFGLLIGILYDVLRVVRLVLSFSKIATYITDFLFSLVSAVMTFLFCLSVTNGEVRSYILLGEFIGFFVFYISFGSVAVKFSEKSVRKIEKAIKRILHFIFSPFIKIFKVISLKFLNFRKKVRKKSKNPKEIVKNLLQKSKKSDII